MSHILHLVPGRYAEVLRLGGRVGVDVTSGEFDAYLLNLGAQPHTENVVHVVNPIDTSEGKTPEEYRRYWHWCRYCDKFTNLDYWDAQIFGARIQRLSEHLRANA